METPFEFPKPPHFAAASNPFRNLPLFLQMKAFAALIATAAATPEQIHLSE